MRVNGRRKWRVGWRTRGLSFIVELLDVIGLVTLMLDVILSSSKGGMNEELG